MIHRRIVCTALACFLHGACVLCLAHARTDRAPEPKLRELEVTMLDPEPPPPTITPEPPAEQPKPARETMRAKPAAPPPPARAGALLTAPEEPTPSPTADEPLRFVTDPNGQGYGSGMVARGGTAQHAEQVATPQPATPTVAAKASLVFAEKLSRQPSLGAHDPCRGHFPQAARSDHGEVSVIATVRDQGSVVRTEIESETPVGEGFGAAARACLAKQRFEPALDDEGKPTAARTRIRIRFAR